MNRFIFHAWAGLGLFGLWSATSGQAAAPDAAEGTMRSGPVVATHFVRPEAIDFKSFSPPAEGSVAAEADLETVLRVQASRTADQVALAKLIEKDEVFNHDDILGAWFVSRDLPLTKAFFKDIGDDLRALDAAAKKPFLRPRPPAVDPQVQPCVTLPASTSFPSGGATQAYVWAEILAELVPAKRAELMARAHRAAWSRVIGGVHFPSDLAGGRRVAEAYLAECRKSGAFRDALEACRREIAIIAPK